MSTREYVAYRPPWRRGEKHGACRHLVEGWATPVKESFLPRPRGGGSVAVLQPPPLLPHSVPALVKSNLPALFPSARKPATSVDVVDLETLSPPRPPRPPPPPRSSFSSSSPPRSEFRRVSRPWAITGVD